jgi:glycine dehydrogenase
VGLTNPATIGADVCHLNLHKTLLFLMAVDQVLANLCKREISSVLPSNPLVQVGGEKAQLFLAPLTALP